MKLGDLKIAYNVLSELDYPVSTEMLIYLSGLIRNQEKNTSERRIARMTEEQLIKLENKQKRVLRIYTEEGLLIQKHTAEETFRAAIRTVEPARIAELGLQIGRRDVIRVDPTRTRKRFLGYSFLAPGYFLIDDTKGTEKYEVLRKIDSLLRLNWEIEFV